MTGDRGPAVSARPHLAPANDRLALASDVKLLGELPAAGFEETHYLIQRGESFVQVGELLYRVAEQSGAGRSYPDIATRVTNSSKWEVTPEVVRTIIEKKLAPLGIMARGEEDASVKSGAGPAPLGVNLRLKTLSPRVIDPVTKVLQAFFVPGLMMPLLAAVAACHAWLYLDHGIGTALAETLAQPGLLLVLVAMVLVAAVVHEFGHASALRYGGAHVRGMGIGLFTIYPVFYTDATEGYRLTRGARVRTDLGGVYFHLLFGLALFGAFATSGLDFFLLGVVLIDIEVIRQFIPFVRLDGYWLVTDLTGIPDLMSHVRPFLKSLVQGRGKGKLPGFKRWVKVLFVAYVVVGVPVLAGLTILFVVRLPELVAGLWDSGSSQVRLIQAALEISDPVLVGIGAVQLAIVGAVLGGTAYFVMTLTSRGVRSLVGGVRGVTTRSGTTRVREPQRCRDESGP